MLLRNTLKGNEGFSFSLRQGKPTTVSLLPALREAVFRRHRVGPAIQLVHETSPRWQPAQLTRQNPATVCLLGQARSSRLRAGLRDTLGPAQAAPGPGKALVPQESLLSSGLWKHYSLSLEP